MSKCLCVVLGCQLCLNHSRLVRHTEGFSCCYIVFILSQGLSTSHALPFRRLGTLQEAGRGCSQDRWLQMARGIFHTKWCHSWYINWEGGKLPLPMSAARLELTGHCATLVLYILILFFFPLKLSLSQSMHFLTFTLGILSHILLQGQGMNWDKYY